MENININELYTSQISLKRKNQIPEMIEYLKTHDRFQELIEIKSPIDDQYIINDGHHRVTAILLSGRTYLNPEEYIIDYDPKFKRFIIGRLIDMKDINLLKENK